MKKCISIFLATMIRAVLSLYSQQGLAVDPASQCILGIPSYNRPLIQNKIGKIPIIITADSVKGNFPDNVTFTGNVDMNQGNSRLLADEVQLHQKQLNGSGEPIRTMDALGNIHYDDDQIILKGPKAWLNLNNKDTNVWESDYQMVGRQGRGKADLVKQRGENRYTILENGTFTSCLPGCDIWSMVGSKVIYDREEQIAKIWNVCFKLGSVPIFYSPYLQLPVGNKRRSGFLTPNAKYSITNSFEFYLPYYWNIAPNMDATITPHYIHKNGNIMWENEFRYLNQKGSGLMELFYLPSDKVFEGEHPKEGNHHRWLYYWQHLGVMDQVWRFNVNFTKVSDPYYFDDFSSKYTSSTDGYITQMFSVGYVSQNFDATVSTRQFQVFSDQIAGIYGAKPQLDVNWYQNDIGPFNIRVYGQLVHFVNSDPNMPEATRVHIEPSINLPWSNDWTSLDIEVKLMATHYQQKNLNSYNEVNNTDLKKLVNRALPQFKMDGRLIFEREINLVGSYIQTLEPRIHYLYVPYRDQNKINNYDSSLLQFNYSGLFLDRIYGGLDRIVPTSQVTTGIISRFFDSNAVERFNISFGQIYYFTKSHVGDDNINWNNDKKRGSLVWASDTCWHMTDRLGLRAGVQYDTCLDNITTGSTLIEYRRDEDHMMKLTYRYANPEYIQEKLLSHNTTEKQYNQGISQIGGEASWLIANRWSVIGAYYFDTDTHKSANQKLGLQYNSCCYAVHVGYERKLNGWNVNSNQGKYDNAIGFNIELRGLSSNYDLNTQQMLRSNVLPYHSNSF